MEEEYRRSHDGVGKALSSKMGLFELCSQLINSARGIKRLKIKPYNWWNEGLHGVARSGVATVFPQAIAMAAAFDEDTVFRAAQIIGRETRAKFNQNQKIKDYGAYKGLTLWSPNINIFRDPRWGRGQETYGEDPYLTGILGAAFIKGVQGDDEKYWRASACAKHFAVHSGPEPKRHKFNAVVSKKDLFETYLPAFEKAVKAGVSGVMGAYNRTNGEPCCASGTLMKKILREGWGFDGYFVSDCGALPDFVLHHRITSNPFRAAALAMNAGCDLECGALYRLLPLCRLFGLVRGSTLRCAAARLMSVRSRLGLFDENCPHDRLGPEEIASPQHEEFAVEVARRSIVLLENDGLLPLKRDGQKILVTGYNAENELAYLGNYNGVPTSYVKILDAVREYNADTVYAEGVHLYDEARSRCRDEALKKAADCDLILMCTGLDASVESEEGGGALAGGGAKLAYKGDRLTLELPEVQKEYIRELLKLNKKLVLLNFSGSCVDLREYKNKADAVLQCWYPGAKGGRAIADILFGRVSPSGKLPVTFYNSVGDLPDFEDYAMHGRTYRYFRGKVQYPFGYGLTYADFALERFEYDRENSVLRVRVENRSGISCDEVLQLYASYPEMDYELPQKALIRIKRLPVPAHSFAETEFKISPSDLYSIDEDGNKVFLKGAYRLSLSDGENINPAPAELENPQETRVVSKCII